MDAGVFVRKVGRKVAAGPSQVAAMALAVPWVKRRVARRLDAAQAAHRAKTPPLSNFDRALVEDLNASGVHITSLETLGLAHSQEMLAALVELAAGYEKLHRDGALKYKDAFQASAAELLAHRAIFDWGLNERLLDIVENYLGAPVAYDGVNVFYTKADGREVAARKWHRDIEDRRVLKIAVYANPVDETGGPFEILTRQPPGEADDFHPSYPVFTQAALEDRFGPEWDDSHIATCTGPAGAVIFAETGRFYHRGRPATGRDRCAVFFNYFARRPLRPFFCERGTLSRRQLRELSNTLSERQRACVAWRDVLPLWLRLIPPAPI